MNTISRRFSLLGALCLAAAAGILASCQSMPPVLHSYEVNLSGTNEVPAVTTDASGSGLVSILVDHSVTAKITMKGMNATAANIHEGAAGTNGPVIIAFTKTGDNEFTVPEGAKLTDAQWVDYEKGKLYLNVQSTKHPRGEVRAQLAQVNK